MGDLPKGHVSAHRPGHSGRDASRVRTFGGRFRHYVLQCRCGNHIPAVRLGCRARSDTAADQRHRDGDLHDRGRPDARQHRLPTPSSRERSATRMSTIATSLSPAELQRAAKDHLWLHFTRMAGYKEGEVPIIVRGDGCYLEDSNGKRYLDALAGLFAVQIGYGFGEEIGEAAAAQMRELPFYTNWSYAHPRAIELAAEVASLAPGDLNRVFFVSGGSEAVEAAWKLARQYYT